MASAGRGRSINTTLLGRLIVRLARPVRAGSAETAIADATTLFVFGTTATTHEPTTSGGCALSGAATANAAFAPPAGGSLLLAGVAEAAAEYVAKSAGGGPSFGSSATIAAEFSPAASGGIATGGSAGVNIDIDARGSGSIDLDGAGHVIYTPAGSGTTYEAEGEGGIVFAGEAVALYEPFIPNNDGGIAGAFDSYPRRRWPCVIAFPRRRQRCQGSLRRVPPCPEGIPPQQTCIGLRLTNPVSGFYELFSHISSYEDFEHFGPVPFGSNMLMTYAYRPAELDAQRWWNYEDFWIECRHDPSVRFRANRGLGFAEAFAGPFQYYDQYEIGGRIYPGVSVAVTAIDFDVSMHWEPLQRPWSHEFNAATRCPWPDGQPLPLISLGAAEHVRWRTRPDNYCFYDLVGDPEWIACVGHNSDFANVEVGAGSLSLYTLISGIVYRGNRWSDIQDRLVTSVYSLLWYGYGGGTKRTSDAYGYVTHQTNQMRGQFINLDDPATSEFVQRYYRHEGQCSGPNPSIETIIGPGWLPGISYFDVP